MIKISKLIRSFKNAFRGVGVVFRTEQSFRVQAFVGILVLLIASFLRVTPLEFIALILMTGAVLILELINSIFERLVDAFKPRVHPIVRDVKDIMAAAVLFTSIIAAVVGVIIFSPYIVGLVDPFLLQ